MEWMVALVVISFIVGLFGYGIGYRDGKEAARDNGAQP
jgi:hypothetical protein